MSSSDRFQYVSARVVQAPKLFGLVLGYGGPIDCWCLVHSDRETRVILSNRDGIFIVPQAHQNATHIPFVRHISNVYVY